VPLPQARNDRILIAWTGFLLLGVNYALLNWGLQYISSGLTAVLQAMTPAFAFVFAHFVTRDERMTLIKAGALALGILGVGVIFSHQVQETGPRPLWGSIAVTAGAVCVASAYVAMRRRARDLHPSAITTGQMLVAVVPLLLYAVLVEGNPLHVKWTVKAVTAVAYLALLGSILAAWLNYWLLKRMSATQLLVMGLIEPLIAVILGAIVLDESMSARTIVGGVAILVSVAFVMDLVPVGSPRSEA
jgi:drug/metabolite transporter (DMT)-like permease